MKKAFTLLELLVVVAIMGMIGTAATSGYTALVRGMRERSAVTAAAAVLRAAGERARVDRVPTAVFCYNRLVKAPTATENGVVVGMMTAVRRSGRLSHVSGAYLCDEFADLDRAYETGEGANETRKGGGVRLFRYGGSNMSAMEYSIVSDRVLPYEQQVLLFSAGERGGLTNHAAYAYYNLKTSAHEPSWRSGDAYAFEFNEMQLPDGMIFGSRVPNSAANDALAETLVFDPDGDAAKTVEIYSTKPDASGYPKQFKKVGTASSDSDEAI